MKEQWRYLGRHPVWYRDNADCYVWICRNPLDSVHSELFWISRIDEFWAAGAA